MLIIVILLKFWPAPCFFLLLRNVFFSVLMDYGMAVNLGEFKSHTGFLKAGSGYALRKQLYPNPDWEKQLDQNPDWKK